MQLSFLLTSFWHNHSSQEMLFDSQVIISFILKALEKKDRLRCTPALQCSNTNLLFFLGFFALNKTNL